MIKRKKRKMADNLPKGFRITENDTYRFRKQMKYPEGIKNFSVNGKTIKECQEAMEKEIKEYEAGVRARKNFSKKSPFQDVLKDWIETNKNPQNNKRYTSTYYDRIMSTFNTHIAGSRLGRLQEQAIGKDDILIFMDSLKKRDIKGKPLVKKDKQGNDICCEGSPVHESLSWSSKKKVFDILHEYFTEKYKGHLAMSPMFEIKPPEKEKSVKVDMDPETYLLQTEDDLEDIEDAKEIKVLNDTEMYELTKLAFLPYRPGLHKDSGYMRGLAIVFSMWIYCRVGELLALTWKDIDLEKKTVRISKSLKRYKRNGSWTYQIGETKTKKVRIVPMDDIATSVIREYKARIAPQSDNTFILANLSTGKPLAPNSLRKSLDAMLKTMGHEHVNYHNLRHTGISFFLRHGCSEQMISAWAGHSSVTITREIYYQFIPEQEQKVITDVNQVTSSMGWKFKIED